MTWEQDGLARLAIRAMAYLVALELATGVAPLGETGGLSLAAPHPLLCQL